MFMGSAGNACLQSRRMDVFDWGIRDARYTIKSGITRSSSVLARRLARGPIFGKDAGAMHRNLFLRVEKKSSNNVIG